MNKLQQKKSPQMSFFLIVWDKKIYIKMSIKFHL